MANCTLRIASTLLGLHAPGIRCRQSCAGDGALVDDRMSRALYCLRHRDTPKVFPVTAIYSSIFNFSRNLYRKDYAPSFFDAIPSLLHAGKGDRLYGKVQDACCGK